MVCPHDADCDVLKSMLLTMGVDSDYISDACTEEEACQSLFDNLMLAHHYLNLENAQVVIDAIKKRYDGRLPIDKTDAAIKQIFDRQPFQCPELGVEIRQPCQVSSCAYWTNHSWTRNCALFYRVDQGRDTLDLKELTFLLDRSVTEIRKRTNKVLAEMRRWALHSKVESDTVREAPSPVAGGCCVCGRIVGNKRAVHKQGFSYCSRRCYQQKPPLDFRIEREFKLPIDRVLSICVDSFAAKRPMCHALNVSSKQLEDLCTRYEINLRC